MITYNPHLRMMCLCSTVFPSILNNYREGGWKVEESIDILDKYHLKGLELSKTFDDNVEALESLDACYGKIRDIIEAEHLEYMLTEEETE